MADATPETGIACPLRPGARGGIATAQGADAIRQSVLTILATHPGERLMRPTFGCPLQSLVFEPNNSATASLARFYVVDALKRWEPRIAIDDVSVVNENSKDGSSLRIELRYHPLTDGQEQTLAFQLPLG
jgi:phage baseplate assembly protein W